MPARSGKIEKNRLHKKCLLWSAICVPTSHRAFIVIYEMVEQMWKIGSSQWVRSLCPSSSYTGQVWQVGGASQLSITWCHDDDIFACTVWNQTVQTKPLHLVSLDHLTFRGYVVTNDFCLFRNCFHFPPYHCGIWHWMSWPFDYLRWVSLQLTFSLHFHWKRQCCLLIEPCFGSPPLHFLWDFHRLTTCFCYKIPHTERHCQHSPWFMLWWVNVWDSKLWKVEAFSLALLFLLAISKGNLEGGDERTSLFCSSIPSREVCLAPMLLFPHQRYVCFSRHLVGTNDWMFLLWPCFKYVYGIYIVVVVIICYFLYITLEYFVVRNN